MVPDPHPNEIAAIFHSQSPMGGPHACRPIPADFFEMERSVARILFEQGKVLVGYSLH